MAKYVLSITSQLKYVFILNNEELGIVYLKVTFFNVHKKYYIIISQI